MVQLRPYQIETLDTLKSLIQQQHTRILVALPTASGKTVIYTCLIGILGITSCKIAVTTNELRLQVLSSLQSAGIKTTTVDTVQKLLYDSDYEDVDLLIIDEVHHIASESWKQLFDKIPAKLTVGFTATPFRTDQEPLFVDNGGPFTAVLTGPSVEELTERRLSS